MNALNTPFVFWGVVGVWGCGGGGSAAQWVSHYYLYKLLLYINNKPTRVCAFPPFPPPSLPLSNE
jgi:hypothetical protein